MENNNIPQQNKLEAGMEVRCKISPDSDYTTNKWYVVIKISGELLIVSDTGSKEYSECWVLGERDWQIEASHKHFDLSNPRWPETEKVKGVEVLADNYIAAIVNPELEPYLPLIRFAFINGFKAANPTA